jgi:hypothetical protein
MTSLIEYLVDLVRYNPDALDAMEASELRKLLPLARRNFYSSSDEMKAAILSACASHLKEDDLPAALALIEKAICFSNDEALVEKLCSFLRQADQLNDALERYSALASRNEALALQLCSYLRQANRLDEALDWCVRIAAHIDLFDSEEPYSTQYRLVKIRREMKFIFLMKGERELYLFCHLDEWWRQRVGNALSGRLLPIDSEDITRFLSGQKTKKALSELGACTTESIVASMMIAIETYASKLMRLSDISLPLVDVEDPDAPGTYNTSNHPNRRNPEYMYLLRIVAAPEVAQKIFQQVFGPFLRNPVPFETYSFS